MVNEEVLRAPYTLQYAYKRSFGPVVSRFMTALRDMKIVGIRAKDGRVLVPPTEYDPVTGEGLDELVDVAETGSVLSWTWVAEPRNGQHLKTPFAFALIKLDGADTSMLHVVDVTGPDAMKTGMRVRARWASKRSGAIHDIEAFEPEGRRQAQS